MPQLLLSYWWLGALAIVLVIAAVTDIRGGKIYDALTYPAILVGLAGHTFAGGLSGSNGDIGLFNALGGLAVGYLPMLLVAMVGGINGGDVKLMGAVGALTGYKIVVSVMFYSFVASAALAVVVIIYRRVLWRTLKRIGFFIWQVLGMTKPTDPASADSPKVPFGLAVCLGSIAAMVENAAGSSGVLEMLKTFWK